MSSRLSGCADLTLSIYGQITDLNLTLCLLYHHHLFISGNTAHSQEKKEKQTETDRTQKRVRQK